MGLMAKQRRHAVPAQTYLILSDEACPSFPLFSPHFHLPFCFVFFFHPPPLRAFLLCRCCLPCFVICRHLPFTANAGVATSMADPSVPCLHHRADPMLFGVRARVQSFFIYWRRKASFHSPLNIYDLLITFEFIFRIFSFSLTRSGSQESFQHFIYVCCLWKLQLF